MIDYSVLNFYELRKMVKNGEIDQGCMGQSLYETVLDGESALEEQDVDVLDFALKGLKQYDKYKDVADVVIWGAAVARHNPGNQTEKSTIRIRKRRAFWIVAAIIFVVVLTGCAAIFDLFGKMLTLSLFTPSQQGGIYMLRTEDERFYSSIEDLLSIEQLNILYPATLPVGYSFTNFEVINRGTNLEVGLYAESPYIDFRVRIGADVQIDDFDNEINGIKYSVFEHEGMYQAVWTVEKDYYRLAVSDETVITEVIKSLRRS
ncbi:MAG: hypothetical protein FWH07_03670 [Oscillospiraceae bacterium]|nr:hypothetical protein [Oscillospiraceae bacterium]